MIIKATTSCNKCCRLAAFPDPNLVPSGCSPGSKQNRFFPPKIQIWLVHRFLLHSAEWCVLAFSQFSPTTPCYRTFLWKTGMNVHSCQIGHQRQRLNQ